MTSATTGLDWSEPPDHLRIGVHELDLLRPIVIGSDRHVARFHQEDLARIV